MNLDYSVVGEVKITMILYVQEIITSFKVHDSSEKLPSLLHLRICSIPLKEQQAVIFHNFVARSLYLTKQARPDIATTVAF